MSVRKVHPYISGFVKDVRLWGITKLAIASGEDWAISLFNCLRAYGVSPTSDNQTRCISAITLARSKIAAKENVSIHS